MARKRKRRRRKSGKFILAVFLLLALGLMSYPFISNYLYENRADGIIETIEKTSDLEADSEEYAAEITAAQAYNHTLLTGHVQMTDPFLSEEENDQTSEYRSLLNMTEDGVMGFIKIPCIDVSLPIYHGTSAKTLESGAGHLQGTSLPIGGESTHSVITGHTGLSRAKLFSDLEELKIGDIFFLKVMNLDLAYEVDDISIVLPGDISKLSIENGKDLCTLITCTPYGINTHRLLVRGHRIDYEEASEDPEVFKKQVTSSKWLEEYVLSIIVVSIGFLILMVILLVFRTVMGQKNRKKQRAKVSQKKGNKEGG